MLAAVFGAYRDRLGKVGGIADKLILSSNLLIADSNAVSCNVVPDNLCPVINQRFVCFLIIGNVKINNSPRKSRNDTSGYLQTTGMAAAAHLVQQDQKQESPIPFLRRSVPLFGKPEHFCRQENVRTAR